MRYINITVKKHPISADMCEIWVGKNLYAVVHEDFFFDERGEFLGSIENGDTDETKCKLIVCNDI